MASQVDELSLMAAVETPNMWLANGALYGLANGEELLVYLRAAFRGCPIQINMVTADQWRMDLSGHNNVLDRLSRANIVLVTPGVPLQYLPLVQPGTEVVLLQYGSLARRDAWDSKTEAGG